MLNNLFYFANIGNNGINLGTNFSFDESLGSNLRSQRSDLLDLIPLNRCVLVDGSRRKSK